MSQGDGLYAELWYQQPQERAAPQRIRAACLFIIPRPANLLADEAVHLGSGRRRVGIIEARPWARDLEQEFAPDSARQMALFRDRDDE